MQVSGKRKGEENEGWPGWDKPEGQWPRTTVNMAGKRNKEKVKQALERV
jgi:hypothetical protein